LSPDFQKQVVLKFAGEEGIQDKELCEAVSEAERGLIDADYGGGVIKQRIARPNEGKSGGFRSIILYRQGKKAFFVFWFYQKRKRQHKNRRGTMVQKDGEKYFCAF
jgi:hypothetical protein